MPCHAMPVLRRAGSAPWLGGGRNGGRPGRGSGTSVALLAAEGASLSSTVLEGALPSAASKSTICNAHANTTQTQHTRLPQPAGDTRKCEMAGSLLRRYGLTPPQPCSARNGSHGTSLGIHPMSLVAVLPDVDNQDGREAGQVDRP